MVSSPQNIKNDHSSIGFICLACVFYFTIVVFAMNGRNEVLAFMKLSDIEILHSEYIGGTSDFPSSAMQLRGHLKSQSLKKNNYLFFLVFLLF